MHDVHWKGTDGEMTAGMSGQPLCGYVWCDDLVVGTLAHSAVQGSCPHWVLVFIVREDNDTIIFDELTNQAGTRQASLAFDVRRRRKSEMGRAAGGEANETMG